MKYMLLAKHVTADQRVLDAGTMVGDGTDYPWEDANGERMPPTTQMMAVDEEAVKEVRDLHQKLYGRAPPWERGVSDEDRAAEDREAKRQADVEKHSASVSDQQEAERKYGIDVAFLRPAAQTAIPPRGSDEQVLSAARPFIPAATASPTVGGDESPSPGPATPKQPKTSEVRPTKPNEEQYPKG